MSDEVVVEISEEPSLARLVKELPPEQQAEFKKELALYDIRARDEDRHRVQDEASRNYQAFYKMFITVAAFSLGGGALTTLYTNASAPWLLAACLGYILAIVLILAELQVSMRVKCEYASRLALNDGVDVAPPDDRVSNCMMTAASVCLAGGLACYALSVALPKL